MTPPFVAAKRLAEAGTTAAGPTPTPHPISNSDFLRAVYGSLREDYGWTTSFAADPSSAPPSVWAGSPWSGSERQCALIDRRGADNNYYSVGVMYARDGDKRRSKDVFGRLAVLLADDVTAAGLNDLVGGYSYALETSKENYQVGVILDPADPDTRNADLIDAVLHAMGASGHVEADSSGNNPVRYARLPVGSNTKTRPTGAFKTRLLSCDLANVYSLADAVAAFGLDLDDIRRGVGKAKVAPDGKAEAGDASELFRAIINPDLDERSYHDALLRISASWVASGMHKGAVVNQLRAIMMAAKPAVEGPEMDRWQARVDEIPRMVEGAEKFAPPDHGETGEASRSYPVMNDAAYIGLAGEITSMIAPHTESDPVAILLTFLTLFGNAVGRGPHYQVEGDAHGGNLFVLLVGDTAKARKGTSFGRVNQIMIEADEVWAKNHIHTGLSSGEGVIWEVRDAITKLGKDGSEEIIDAGCADKRLMVVEPEFASVLQVAKREGNIITRVLRDAFDGRNLATLTKNSPAKSTAPFISVLGHVTSGELQKTLDTTDMTNGFANRFLFSCVRRSKILPFGGNLGPDKISAKSRQVGDAIIAARRINQVTMSAPAAAAWVAVYPELSAAKLGMVGSLTARQEAHTVRLALLYALLEASDKIEPRHLSAALAVTEYSRASVEYIYGDTLGDAVADTILSALKAAGAGGLTRTEISNNFSRNCSRYQIDRALKDLAHLGRAKVSRDNSTGGRPGEVWFATGT